MKQNHNCLALALLLVVAGCSDKKQNSIANDETDHHGDVKYVSKVNCMNNLKMIGIAFKVWASDHDQKFPFQVSTNNGGTLELVLPDKDGFDSNAFLYLKIMNGEEGLTTTRLLICPQDKSKNVASNWTNLQLGNVSYQFCSDKNFGPFSSHILAVCPVDGNVLYCDGTVLGKNEKPPIKSESIIFNTMTSVLSSNEKSPKADDPLIVLPEKPTSQLKLKP